MTRGGGICSYTKLPSKIFYKQLEYNTLSAEKCGTYRSILGKDYEEGDKVTQLCGMLVKFLENNPPLENNQNITCNRCKLLSYWIYQELQKIFGGHYTKCLDAYSKLQLMWSHAIKDKKYKDDNICQLEIFTNFGDKWELKQKFYEYCEDYEYINVSSKMKYPFCEDYRNYIDKKFISYSDIDKDFVKQKIIECSSAYRKRESCRVNFDLVELLKNKDTLKVKGSKAAHSDRRHDKDVQGKKAEESNAFWKFVGHYDKSGEFKLNTSPSHIVTYVSSLIIISIVSFHLFKLTPWGSRSRKRTQHEYKIMNDFSEENMEAHLNHSEHPDKVEQGEKVRIAYSPV
ncbi:unnamed protein product [Plasmodium vivax]|uniref:(malaria parasite P. vivax) hypothetical protein n=1 Tax=Plasmodium vivax TaxID=5855 RepID=A0A8S4HA34_PLAVI|nr:unnamed protein product [Plasmodium vivax]